MSSKNETPTPLGLAPTVAPIPQWVKDLPSWLGPPPAWVTENLRPHNAQKLGDLATIYGLEWEGALNVAVSDAHDGKIANHIEAGGE